MRPAPRAPSTVTSFYKQYYNTWFPGLLVDAVFDMRLGLHPGLKGDCKEMRIKDPCGSSQEQQCSMWDTFKEKISNYHKDIHPNVM